MTWTALWRSLRRRFRPDKPRKTWSAAANPVDYAHQRERERRDEQTRFVLALRRLLETNPRLRSRPDMKQKSNLLRLRMLLDVFRQGSTIVSVFLEQLFDTL